MWGTYSDNVFRVYCWVKHLKYIKAKVFSWPRLLYALLYLLRRHVKGFLKVCWSVRRFMLKIFLFIFIVVGF